MEKVTRNITVDLSRKSNVRVVFATQNDFKSRRLLINLTDDGRPYKASRSDSAIVSFMCDNETGGAYLATVREDGSIEYVIDAALLLIKGQTKCTVTLAGANGERLTSAPFVIDVSETLYAGEDISPEAAESLMDSMMKAHAAMQKAEVDREMQESLRKLCEIERTDYENERVDAELKRMTAEQNRAASESQRRSAETERAKAEEKRRDYYEEVDQYILGIEEVQKGYISEQSDAVALVNLKRVYPVGAIYMSVEETSPAELFGGTWERLKDRFLLGAGDTYEAGATGGSDAHSHTHDLWADICILSESSEHRSKGTVFMKEKQHENFVYMDYVLQDNGALTRVVLPSRGEAGAIGYKRATNVGGTIGTSSNMPPYLAVYMWKRVA